MGTAAIPVTFNHIHGAEAERVRGELADMIRDLLDWAAQQQSGDPPLRMVKPHERRQHVR